MRGSEREMVNSGHYTSAALTHSDLSGLYVRRLIASGPGET
jgi:hypothetical protein